MNISEFTSLLDTKSPITIRQTNAVEDILESYPYFQAARMIHLKGLRNQYSFKYNSALKSTAAYTTNRTVLFDFITANTLDNSDALEKQQKIIETNEVVGLEVVKQSAQNQSNTQIVEETEVKKAEEKLKIGKPLVFDLSEMHSFSEWLRLTNVKPIQRKEKSETKTTEKQHVKNQEKFDIIEQFITSKPKLEANTAIEAIDVSFESVKEDGTLMTETLARVYLEQKKYDKAIQAFKILSLKYPEKSSFFADRIKAIKFLQKNNS